MLELVEASNVSIVSLGATNTSIMTQIVSDVPQSHTSDMPLSSLIRKRYEEMGGIADELKDFHPQTYRLEADFPIGICHSSCLVGNIEFTDTDSPADSVLTPATSSDGVSYDRVPSKATSLSNTDLSIPVSQLYYSKLETGTIYTYPQTISDSDLHDDTDKISNQDTCKARTVPSPLENSLALPYPTRSSRKSTNGTYPAHQYHRKTYTITPVEDEVHNTDSPLRRWLKSMDNEDNPIVERWLQFL